MILEVLELEVEQDVERPRHFRDWQGHAMVVRNGGSDHERTFDLGAGPLKTKSPHVNDRCPEQKFTSKLLSPHPPCSPRLERALTTAASTRVVHGRLLRGSEGAPRDSNSIWSDSVLSA